MQFWKRILATILFLIAIISISLYSTETPELIETSYMPKMKNETLRKQLGNAGWHLLHTISVKYPKNPSYTQQKEYLEFLRLFAKFYPCGECSAHFQQLLELKPPRVKSKSDVIEWTCEVHNVVNDRLGKELKNCSTVEQEWQCGCGDSE